jgi:hypothetical protein
MTTARGELAWTAKMKSGPIEPAQLAADLRASQETRTAEADDLAAASVAAKKKVA